MNDKEFRLKVLKAIFLHPAVVIPFGLGFILVLESFFGLRGFRVLGGLSIFAGLGVLMSRLTWKFEDIAQKTFTKWHNKTQAEQKRSLDFLENELVCDGDPRTERALGRLRALYKAFVDSVKSGKVKEYNFLNTAEKLFKTSIGNLRLSYTKWQQAMELPGDCRSPLMAERDRLIKEVEASTESLANAVEQVHELQASKSGELARIREELDKRLDFARRVEGRIEQIENGHVELE